jgi:hypothetical protein
LMGCLKFQFLFVFLCHPFFFNLSKGCVWFVGRSVCCF